jgi:hypothetical protein
MRDYAEPYLYRILHDDTEGRSGLLFVEDAYLRRWVVPAERRGWFERRPYAPGWGPELRRFDTDDEDEHWRNVLQAKA